VIRSGAHRFREGAVDVGLPGLLAGEATVHETYDDRAACFRIRVHVANRRFGPLFGYRGSFRIRYLDTAALGVRPGLRPVREECRT
jgi:hypothetical protein